MAQLRIKGNVRIGCIYDCNFGLYKEKGSVTKTTTDHHNAELNFNYRIPQELIKKRPVIVVSKHRGLCVVVPISTTKEIHKKESKIPENQGLHVKLTSNDFPKNSYQYDNREDMWAKCNLVSCIDAGRLSDLFSKIDENGQKIFVETFKIPDETLFKIRLGILKAIGCSALLKNLGLAVENPFE